MTNDEIEILIMRDIARKMESLISSKAKTDEILGTLAGAIIFILNETGGSRSDRLRDEVIEVIK